MLCRAVMVLSCSQGACRADSEHSSACPTASVLLAACNQSKRQASKLRTVYTSLCLCYTWRRQHVNCCSLAVPVSPAATRRLARFLPLLLRLLLPAVLLPTQLSLPALTESHSCPKDPAAQHQGTHRHVNETANGSGATSTAAATSIGHKIVSASVEHTHLHKHSRLQATFANSSASSTPRPHYNCMQCAPPNTLTLTCTTHVNAVGTAR
jgi:hypothetical protein